MGKKKKKKFSNKGMLEIGKKEELKKETGIDLAEAEIIMPSEAKGSADEMKAVDEDEAKEAETEKVETVGDVAGEDGVVVEKPITEKERNRKVDTYIEFILIFILGVLIGVAFKTEAEKRFTIGFDDYKMKMVRQDYDINKIQADVTKKSMEDANSQEDTNGAPGGSDTPADANSSDNSQDGDGSPSGDGGISNVQQ